MDELRNNMDDDALRDPKRRTLLSCLLAGYVISSVHYVFPQAQKDTAGAAFLAVSKFLTGRSDLDVAQATRLYDALNAGDPRFATNVQALLTLIKEREITSIELQQVLDAEKSPLATLPGKIVTGWYMGIVGIGAQARVLAYESESALNAVIVSDVLKPPTYCYGVYGSWASKPG